MVVEAKICMSPFKILKRLNIDLLAWPEAPARPSDVALAQETNTQRKKTIIQTEDILFEAIGLGHFTMNSTP